MNIIKTNLKFKNSLSKRPYTRYIVLHHMAGSGSVEDIHNMHIKNNGWAGIGYHFFVRKDGTVYEGRPIDALGAHVENKNSQCLGICFEGNFENEKMSELQIKAGSELVSYVKGIYPDAQVKKHSDLNATACPGRYFPFESFSNSKATANISAVYTGNENTVNITLNQLSKGSEGNQIRVLQTLLIAASFFCGKSGIDGDFGNDTLQAVKSFQKKSGLTADGIVGINTWNKLLKG